MPDVIDSTGLTVKTLNEILEELNDGYKAIYGADINILPNSPDGQLIGIFSQALSDIRELLVTIDNNFDPDNAIGRFLDQRVSINNIKRKGGTFTTVEIDITVSANTTVDLQGLDGTAADVNGTGYTIQDDAGNQFILFDSVTLENILPTPEIFKKNFRAKDIGAVTVSAGTIQNFVTIVLGVESVDNPLSPLQIGEDEETDANLRTRRQQSVSVNSAGFLNGIIGALLSIQGVTEAQAFENITNSIDSDGIPAHGIWVIVEGGGSDNIANVIMNKKSYGANQRGDIIREVDTPTTPTSGIKFEARFDRPLGEALFIDMTLNNNDASVDLSESLATIKTQIKDNLPYKIGERAEISRIDCVGRDVLSSLNINAFFSGIKVFSAALPTPSDSVKTFSLQHQFTVDEVDITILIVNP